MLLIAAIVHAAEKRWKKMPRTASSSQGDSSTAKGAIDDVSNGMNEAQMLVRVLWHLEQEKVLYQHKIDELERQLKGQMHMPQHGGTSRDGMIYGNGTSTAERDDEAPLEAHTVPPFMHRDADADADATRDSRQSESCKRSASPPPLDRVTLRRLRDDMLYGSATAERGGQVRTASAPVPSLAQADAERDLQSESYERPPSPPSRDRAIYVPQSPIHPTVHN